MARGGIVFARHRVFMRNYNYINYYFIYLVPAVLLPQGLDALVCLVGLAPVQLMEPSP